MNYVNNRTAIRLRCNKHGDVFERLPLNLLKGWGCPSYNKEQGKTWANTVACTYDPQRRMSIFVLMYIFVFCKFLLRIVIAYVYYFSKEFSFISLCFFM